MFEVLCLLTSRLEERDKHIASSVLHCSGQNIVAVVGLAHMAGVQKHLENVGGYMMMNV